MLPAFPPSLFFLGGGVRVTVALEGEVKVDSVEVVVEVKVVVMVSGAARSSQVILLWN